MTEKHPLIDLEEYNEIAAAHYGKYEPTYNGIRCPRCSNELIDAELSVTISTYPPRKRVECLECNFKSTRVV